MRFRMASPTQLLDWSRVPVFLAVAETGSLSAAAKRLGQSQPTLGRQIRAMEEELGLTLFTRQARGLVLTETGRALLDPARAMAAEAHRLSLAAVGKDERVVGTVRITASQGISHFVLPPILAALRTAEPQIQVELSPSDASENLLFREADIALRMYRPTQLDMVARHVADLPLGLYGTPDFIARVGRPQTIRDALHAGIVGNDRDDRILRGMRAYGIDAERDDFPVRCDDALVNWQLARAGCGFGFAAAPVGDADPAVERVLADLPLPVLPVWLVTHEAMRRTPRIARVWDLLAAGLAERLPAPSRTTAERKLGEPGPAADAPTGSALP